MIWFAATPRAPKRLALKVVFAPDATGSRSGRTAVHHLVSDAAAPGRTLLDALYQKKLLVPGLLLAQRRSPPHDRDLDRVQRVLDTLRRERLLAVYADGSEPAQPPPPAHDDDVAAMDLAHTLVLADLLGACEAALASWPAHRPAAAAVRLSQERVLPIVDSLRATGGVIPVPSRADPDLSPEMQRAVARQQLLEAGVASLLETTLAHPDLTLLGDELHAYVSQVVEPLRAGLRNRTPDRDRLAQYAYGELVARVLGRYLHGRLKGR